MNRLELLSELAEKAKRPEFMGEFDYDGRWTLSQTVAARDYEKARVDFRDAVEESWSALLAVARVLAEGPCISGGQYRCWEGSEDEPPLPREDWCKPCAALAPLLREEPES